jgi:hypothetical protein
MMTIDEALNDVKKLQHHAKGMTRRRDDIYLLLAEIYRVARKWLKLGQPGLRRQLIARLKRRFDRRTTKSVFRFLIEATLQETDVKARSRYSNALRYAHAKNRPHQQLIVFIKRNGGIEMCAQRFIADARGISPGAREATRVKPRLVASSEQMAGSMPPVLNSEAEKSTRLGGYDSAEFFT